MSVKRHAAAVFRDPNHFLYFSLRDPEAFRSLLGDLPAFLGVLLEIVDFGIYPTTKHVGYSGSLFDAARTPEAAKTMFAAPHQGVGVVDFRAQGEAHPFVQYNLKNMADDSEDMSDFASRVASDLDYMIIHPPRPRPRRRKKAALA